MRPVLIGFLVSLLLHGAILGGVLHFRRVWAPDTVDSPLALDLSAFAPLSVEESTDPGAIGEASSATVAEADPESVPEPGPTPLPEPEPDPEPESEPEPEPEPRPEPEPEPRPEPEPEPRPEPEPEPRPEPEPEREPEPRAETMVSESTKTPSPVQPGVPSDHIPGAGPRSGSTRAGESKKPSVPAEGVKSGVLAAAEADYGDHVRSRIEANKFYPRRAMRLRREGTVGVGFTIRPDGAYSGVTVVESSGVAVLDDAALEAVSRVGQFGPFPEIIQRDSWDFRIVLVYELK